VTLRDPSGFFSHALFAAPPSSASVEEGTVNVGDHLRVDGLFFKVFRSEVDGEWLEGPLVLSHRAIASFAPISEGDARAASALQRVHDDELGAMHGDDQEALWQLMARAKLLSDETDWSAAQEIDTDLLERMFDDGEAYRGIPVRFPVSRNMGSYTETASENPLGLDRITVGWIGNVMWRNPVGVVKWLAPYDLPHLAAWNDPKGAKFVEARGWFFRNHVYKRLKGDPGRAPLFVLASIEPFYPPPDKLLGTIMWFTVGMTAFVIASIFLLLRADKKKSSELHEALTRRKRERRLRAAVVGSGAAPGAGASMGPS
jgi:heme exporter protein D